MRLGMPDLLIVEGFCEEKDITLVIHPAIRKALAGFEEEFSRPAAAFLKGAGRTAYFLPLQSGGDVKLVFSLRYSAGEHLILRVHTATPEGLERIKVAVRRAEACR